MHSVAREDRYKGMRGYFAIGVEGISKSMNVGNLVRSAHAFGGELHLHSCRSRQGRTGSLRHIEDPFATAVLPLAVH